MGAYAAGDDGDAVGVDLGASGQAGAACVVHGDALPRTCDAKLTDEIAGEAPRSVAAARADDANRSLCAAQRDRDSDTRDAPGFAILEDGGDAERENGVGLGRCLACRNPLVVGEVRG